MNPEKRQIIEPFIKDNPCPQDYACINQLGAKHTLKPFLSNKNLLVCLNEKPGLCHHALNFGNRYFCQCPTIRKLLELLAQKKLQISDLFS